MSLKQNIEMMMWSFVCLFHNSHSSCSAQYCMLKSNITFSKNGMTRVQPYIWQYIFLCTKVKNKCTKYKIIALYSVIYHVVRKLQDPRHNYFAWAAELFRWLKTLPFHLKCAVVILKQKHNQGNFTCLLISLSTTNSSDYIQVTNFCMYQQFAQF